jgi:UDP-glucose 4-epimerase
MKILVTGGAGFIGSHIADALLSLGFRVDVLDNLTTGLERNVPEKARFFKNSIDDPEVESILKNGYDVICHHAAQIDLRKSVTGPVNDLINDVAGSVQLFQWAANSGVKQIVYASSGGAIYGEQDYFPADEEHPKRPASPYGIHKWMIEKNLQYFYKQYGLLYSALRYANIYGPRQNAKSEAGVVSIFCTKLLANEAVVINGNGKQTRDFVYVDDVVRANIVCIDKRFCGEINIGTGIESSVNDIFRILKELSGSDQDETYGPPKEGEQFRSVLSNKKAKELLNWSPEVSFDDGLKRTFEFFKNENTV